ncbi:MAG: helix-turn-helix transcriptional regulator [Rhizobacter sp.]|nr:helix-turn-helix transcriptional regulator [Bacteriovorax sp.]
MSTELIFRNRNDLEKYFGPLTFAKFIRACRTSKDMNQKEFAKFLGIAPGTLCDLEKGRQLVSPELAKKYAKKCGLSEKVAITASLEDQLRKAKIKYHVELVA